MRGLAGQVVAVTGAGGGIGAAASWTARRLKLGFGSVQATPSVTRHDTHMHGTKFKAALGYHGQLRR